MKSYTDLEQSKKLAEFLPLESADMCWCNNSIKGINYTDKFSVNLYTVKEMKDVFDEALVGWDKYWELVPCWSLAALLGVLPQFIEFKGNKYYLRFMKEYVEYANDEISITGRCLHTTGNDNLVDKKIRAPVNEWNSSVTTWIPDKSIKTNIY